MQIITGQVARKDNFWPRDKELNDIWYKINSNQHILLVAPRRVGKTSILRHIEDNSKATHIVLYITVESANSENEFWKRIFSRLMDEDFINTLQNKAGNFWEKLKGIKISEISTKGVKFGDSKEIEYLEAFKTILKNLDEDKKLIIMIDEFAQAIENIINFENIKSAKSLLQNHRELRQDERLSKQVTFIYAGSIGLESVTSKIGSIAAINDLTPIKVPPLSNADAKKFIKALASSNNIKIAEPEIDYILEKIEWLLPFYIQLILDELKKYEQDITTQMIDETFWAILKNKNQFEHWHTRLRSPDNEYQFAKEILDIASKNSTIQSNDISNLATKYTLAEDMAKEIRNSLVYDGYINNNDNPKEYRFNSPLLKMWWYKNVAN